MLRAGLRQANCAAQEVRVSNSGGQRRSRLAAASVPANSITGSRDQLDIVEIPLLHWLPRAEPPIQTYRDLVARRQFELRCLLSPPPLELDAVRHELRLRLPPGRHAPVPAVELAAQQFFWYAYLASLASEKFPRTAFCAALDLDPQRSRPGAPVARLTTTDAELTRHFEGLWRLYRQLHRGTADVEDLFHRELFTTCGRKERKERDPSAGSSLRVGGNPSGIVSRTNDRLEDAWGYAAKSYQIRGGREKGGYWLQLDQTLLLWSGPSERVLDKNS